MLRDLIKSNKIVKLKSLWIKNPLQKRKKNGRDVINKKQSNYYIFITIILIKYMLNYRFGSIISTTEGLNENVKTLINKTQSVQNILHVAPIGIYSNSTALFLIFLKKKLKRSRQKLQKILINISVNAKLKKILSRYTLRRKKKRIRIVYQKWRLVKKRLRFFKIKTINTLRRTHIKKNKMLRTRPKKPRLKKHPIFKNFIFSKIKKKTAQFDREQKKYFINKYTPKSHRRRRAARFKKNYIGWITSGNTQKSMYSQKQIPSRIYIKKYKVIMKWIKYTTLYRKKKKFFRNIKRFFNLKSKIFIKKAKLKLYKFIKQKTRQKKNRFVHINMFKTKLLAKKNNLNCNLVTKIFSFTLYKYKNDNIQPCTIKTFRLKIDRNALWTQRYKIYKNNSVKIKTPKLPQIVRTRKNIKRQFFYRLFKTNVSAILINQNVQNQYITSIAQFNLNIFQKGSRNRAIFRKVRKLFTKSKKRKNTRNKLLPVILNKNSFIPKIFNNYLPLFLSLYKQSKTNKRSLKTKNYYLYIQKLKKLNFKNFFMFYLLNFLENFLKKKIWLQLNARDPIKTFWKKYINYVWNKNLFKYKKFVRLISIREALEIIIISFTTQDLQILLRFLKRKFEKSHFKKHKKIISILFHLIKQNPILFKLTPIKGFSFDIRGKVGASGNAKKRHVFFSFGKISTTSQNTKSYWQQIEIWTPTGQMGLTCLIQHH